MKVLSEKYVVGTDKLLDIIYSTSLKNQKELANVAGISISALERKIKKLKEDGLLHITRDIEKNIYYCIGIDADSKWNSTECREIYRYRNPEDKDYKQVYRKVEKPLISPTVELDYVVDMLEQDLRDYSNTIN